MAEGSVVSINSLYLAIQALNFLFFFALFKYIFLDKLESSVEKREEYFKNLEKEIADLRKIFEEKQAIFQRILKEANEEADKILKQAVLEAQKEAQKLIEEAKQEEKEKIEKILISIRQDFEEAKKELKTIIPNLAKMIVEKILGKKAA